jgi:hypothetical protein
MVLKLKDTGMMKNNLEQSAMIIFCAFMKIKEKISGLVPSTD